MEREGFVFYRSFYDAIKDLDAESFKRIMAGICEYGLNSTIPGGLFGIENTIFTLVRPLIDANNKRYKNGCKGGQYGHLGGAPKGNSNAVKDWDNISKQPQWGGENNPKTTPKDKDKDKEKEKEKDKEKGYGEKRDVDITLAATAARGKKIGELGKKNIVPNAIEPNIQSKGAALEERLSDLGLETDIIELAIVYDKCKKGKKLSKFDDKQLGIRVKKLRRCGFNTIEGMRQVLENSIAGGYQGIFELKQPIKPTPKYGDEGETPKVVEKGGYYFYNV